MTTREQALSGTTRPTVETNQQATFWWRFMRWSGVLLIPLAFGHLAIVHLLNSVAVIDRAWVVQTRWSFLGWRIYDASMLWLAGIHGYRGFRTVVNDYVHNEGLNRALIVLMTAIMIGLLILGSIALIGTPVQLPQ